MTADDVPSTVFERHKRPAAPRVTPLDIQQIRIRAFEEHDFAIFAVHFINQRDDRIRVGVGGGAESHSWGWIRLRLIAMHGIMNSEAVQAGQWQVESVTWAESAQALDAVRTEVFVGEQGVAPEIESDGMDALCWHALATDSSGRAIGAARLAPDGKIGRMAVLKWMRGRGIGSALLTELVEQAKRQGMAAVFLHAQAQAAAFYARLGFTGAGEPFLEAEIEHQRMIRRIDGG